MIYTDKKDALHDEAIKSHEQNQKDYDEAMKANKDAIDLVSGDNTKKKDGKVKSKNLKKMHLSEELFYDIDQLSDVEDVEDELNESSQLDEASGDFLDKVSKKVVGNIDLGIFEALDTESENIKKKESSNELDDLKEEIIKSISEKYPDPDDNVEVYNAEIINDKYIKIDFKITGNIDTDHRAFKVWMNQHADAFIDCDIKWGGDEDADDTDNASDYTAITTYYFIPKESPNDLNNEEEFDSEDENDIDSLNDNIDEGEFEDDSMIGESIKFNIAKEQLKRFNEGKMPSNWSPNVYLENLTNRKHITASQKQILEQVFLRK